MKRQSIWIGVVAGLMLVAASAVVLVSFGNAGAAENLEVQGPPRDGSCICSANWAPVVCTGSDGTRHAYSNACVAGCYGYTTCQRIVVAP